MARKPTPPERKTVNYSVALGLDVIAFLEQQKVPLGFGASAELVRKLIESMRTWFNLPAYMAEAVEKDMERRGLNFFTYVQELLARHAQQLLKAEQEKDVGHKR
jgi:hypothetical protein